jgi:hypothetical protein
MAANLAKAINWDKILSKVSDPSALRGLNALRAKANEVNSFYAKEDKPMEAIDFNAYRSKLTFTGAGVDKIEPMLKNVKIPQYTAVLPDFEKNQRAELMSILDTATEAARVELNDLYKQRDDFEANVRVTQYTTMADIRRRFPDIARSNEDEINQHLWFYNKETTRENLLECKEDNQDAHCKDMDDTSGFNLKTDKIETVIGEDSYCAKETKVYVLDP